MASADALADPSFSKVLLSFVVGIVVGVAIAAPAIPPEIADVIQGDPGPVGSVLIVGVLSIVVVTTGLVGLYQLFWLLDK